MKDNKELKKVYVAVAKETAEKIKEIYTIQRAIKLGKTK